MIESRCGLLCGKCGYKEQMNCRGCIQIEKPFWGESCPVKSCCETRTQDPLWTMFRFSVWFAETICL